MTGTELRHSGRLRSYLGAKIFFADKPSTFDCLIRNFSDNGARIEIESVWDIPDTFQIYIDKFGKSFDCTVRWKNHNTLGVSYACGS